MPVHTATLTLRTPGRGTHEITAQVEDALRRCGLREGTVTIFCQHTSCSLVLMENADPSARRDLHRYFDRLVPDGSPDFTHTLEGDDDMSAHIKMALTRSAEVVPFKGGRLLLGTWQGIFLWEHRVHPHSRQVVLTFHGE
ncbi:MAG TPA: secondary thiamine-phosphate synthase enzyme YjbQ [Opitutales bacterium]|nr:secondary thiamine-phosphate synthase enzyme YjbQ [Opitutales bacterium]